MSRCEFTVVCAQRHRNSHEAQSLAKHHVKPVHRHRNSHEAQSLAKHQVRPVHSVIATPTKLRVLPNTKSDLCTASSQLPRSSESCQTPSQTCAQPHRNSHEAESLAKHHVRPAHTVSATHKNLRVLPSTNTNLSIGIET